MKFYIFISFSLGLRDFEKRQVLGFFPFKYLQYIPLLLSSQKHLPLFSLSSQISHSFDRLDLEWSDQKLSGNTSEQNRKCWRATWKVKTLTSKMQFYFPVILHINELKSWSVLWLQSKILQLCIKQSTYDWGWTFNAHCNQTRCLSNLRSSDDNSHCHAAAPAVISCMREALSSGSHHLGSAATQQMLTVMCGCRCWLGGQIHWKSTLWQGLCLRDSLKEPA